MNKRYSWSLVILLFQWLIMPRTGYASEFLTADDIHINSTFRGNIYAAGKSITVDDTLTGDLMAAGMEILINNTIHGDLTLASYQTYIRGPIHGDVRSICGNLEISDHVYGDLIVLAGKVVINENAVIHGDILIYGNGIVNYGLLKKSVKLNGSDITLHGTYEGPVEINGSEVLLNGKFEQATQLIAKEIELDDSLLILYDLTYYSEEGKQDFSTYLSGQAKAIWEPQLAPTQPETVHEENTISFFGYYNIATLLGAILVIAFLVFASKDTFRISASYLKNHYINSIGLGLIVFITIPILIVLLFITLIGIPIAILLILLYITLFLLSHSFSAIVIANIIQNKYGLSWNKWILTAVAILVYLLLKGLIYIPVIGWLLYVIVIIACIGAIMKGRRQLLRKETLST